MKKSITYAYGTFKSNNIKRLKEFVSAYSSLETEVNDETKARYTKAYKAVISTERDENLECDYQRFVWCYGSHYVAERRLADNDSLVDVANELITQLSPVGNAPSDAYWQQFYALWLFLNPDDNAPKQLTKERVIELVNAYSGTRANVNGFKSLTDAPKLLGEAQ